MKTRKNNYMSPFCEWKKGLHDEDVFEFGFVINRPDSAYQILYEIYRKKRYEEKNKIK